MLLIQLQYTLKIFTKMYPIQFSAAAILKDNLISGAVSDILMSSAKGMCIRNMLFSFFIATCNVIKSNKSS